jgi:hypothetical protein
MSGDSSIKLLSLEVNTVGPLKKMFQIASSIALFYLKIEVAIKKANIILSFSNSPLLTFTKMVLVMLIIKSLSRSSIVSLLGLAMIARLKSALTY